MGFRTKKQTPTVEAQGVDRRPLLDTVWYRKRDLQEVRVVKDEGMWLFVRHEGKAKGGWWTDRVHFFRKYSPRDGTPSPPVSYR